MKVTALKLKVQVWVFCRLEDPSTVRFLCLRTRPDRESFWQPITGSVEPGESLEAAALREAQEETGLLFNHPPRSLGRTFEFISRGQKFEEHGFYLEAPLSQGHLPRIQLDPHEHVESQWVTSPEAFERLKFPSNSEMLIALLSALALN